jgi:hypothetical protein
MVSKKNDALRLEEQLVRWLCSPEVMSEIEARLEKADDAGAASLLQGLDTVVPRVRGGPDLFDGIRKREPREDELLVEGRDLVYLRVRHLADPPADLVRGLVVTESPVGLGRLLAAFAGLERIALAPWMRKALGSVCARLRGDAAREKQLLLEAVRGHADELALFVGLARNQRGTGSEVELFALRQCVRLVPTWAEALDQLHEGADAIDDPDAAEIDRWEEPEEEGSEEWEDDRDAA